MPAAVYASPLPSVRGFAMKSFLILGSISTIFIALAGCGPLQTPLPQRPNAEGQRAIDEAWDKALRPVERFDHQTLLDILMCTKAYEVGVDKLTLRSEKKVAAGKVVMEIHYDRMAPAEDRFEVQVLDEAGRSLRKERYGREEIEQTYTALFVHSEHLRRREESGMATPEEVQELAAYRARLKVVEDVFPKRDDGKDQGGKLVPKR
jgi:hypothetical protein